jgi:hypothetical protein
MDLPSATTDAVSDNEVELYVQQVCKIVIAGNIRGMLQVVLLTFVVPSPRTWDVHPRFTLSGRVSLTQAIHID